MAGTYFRPNIKGVFLEPGVGTGIMYNRSAFSTTRPTSRLELTEKGERIPGSQDAVRMARSQPQGIPIAGKAFDQQGQFGISSGVYAYDTSLGDLIIATIRATTNAAGNQLRLRFADCLWNLKHDQRTTRCNLSSTPTQGWNMLLKVSASSPCVGASCWSATSVSA